ncbi:MAG: hypothetical protein ABW044_01810, partial [Cellvibrio sp.]
VINYSSADGGGMLIIWGRRMSNSEFSFLRGVSFVFNDDGNEIKAWFSAFTGLEKVYVNGALVLSQRNLSIKSKSTFQIDNNLYSVVFQVENFLNGTVMCTLSRNGVAYQRKKFVSLIEQPIWLKISIYLGCLVLVAVAIFLNFPSEYYFILAILYAILATYVNAKVRKIVIQDVNV